MSLFGEGVINGLLRGLGKHWVMGCCIFCQISPLLFPMFKVSSGIKCLSCVTRLHLFESENVSISCGALPQDPKFQVSPSIIVRAFTETGARPRLCLSWVSWLVSRMSRDGLAHMWYQDIEDWYPVRRQPDEIPNTLDFPGKWWHIFVDSVLWKGQIILERNELRSWHLDKSILQW